jgi:hypothetical protein
MSDSVKVSEATAEQIHAALAKGDLREVVIFCDVCGLEMATDMIGETAEGRFDGARRWLRSHRGWISAEGQDICPFCEAGVQMCVQGGHEFCEHSSWVLDPETGIAVHPAFWTQFSRARTLAFGLEPSVIPEECS